MAKLFIAYWKSVEIPIQKRLCFWEGLFQELVNNGNEIMIINTAHFNNWDNNEVYEKELDAEILKQVEAFNPDVIITFNNRCPKCVLEHIDVPIITWDGDDIAYSCDLEYIKQNIDRYKVFSMAKDWTSKYYDFGFQKDDVFRVIQATAILPQDIEQNKKISFLGALTSNYSTRIIDCIKNEPNARDYYKVFLEFVNNKNYEYEEIYNVILRNGCCEVKLDYVDLWGCIDYRWILMTVLLDLDITINGYDEDKWTRYTEFAPQLAAAVDKSVVWSLKENQDFYNSSVISLCPMHPQAVGKGFSWRAFDVMASNACLLSSKATELSGLVKDYIELPMFDNPWEARSLCIELVKNDKWRTDIVKASQQYIDENARWIHRFRDMEQMMGLTLINSGVEGSFCDLYDLVKDKRHKNDLENGKLYYKNKEQQELTIKDKVRYKVWQYLDRKLRDRGVINYK